MLDVELFELDAGMHHMVSMLLHLVNSVCLFLLLWRVTGAIGKSLLVAALFSVHPLHVESVAWVSERKDMLSALFFTTSLLAYSRYAERRGWAMYAASVALFATGLMAKPMLVTLPLLLLALDYWPLQRSLQASDMHERGSSRVSFRSLRTALLEKAPFFLLAGISSVITILAQDAGGAVQSLESHPLHLRIGNSLVSYSTYIVKAVWPGKLSIFYPYPEAGHPWWKVTASSLLLAGIFAAVAARHRKYPFLLTGWAWFFVSLLPVIGLIQVGDQSMADRYTYIPLTGLFLIFVWGGSVLARSLNLGRSITVPAVLLILLTLSAIARQRVHEWHDNITIYRSAIAATSANWVSHENLGVALVKKEGKAEEALWHYWESLRIKPNRPKPYNYIGVALGHLGRNTESIAAYRQAIRLDPSYAEAYFNLGLAYLSEGNTRAAMDIHARLRDISPHWAGRLLAFLRYSPKKLPPSAQ